jgi:[ribosomal protein S18]-alanine N-acetyltransferase
VTTGIRPLRGADVWQVLALQRHAFPEDPWTTSTAAGSLSRLTRGGQARYAGSLARLLRLLRLNQAAGLIRLVILVTLGRPRGLSYIVAGTGASVAGYASLRATPGGEAEIPMIAVRADRRGERIGTRLVGELISMAEARKCRSVFLYVRAGNTTAHHLYRRTGFADTAVLPGFYQPSGTDAVVMHLSLPRPHPPVPPGAQLLRPQPR